MSQSIRDTIPKVLKTLWDLEKELRSAAQNGVVLRREDASRHLSDARRHLDALLGLTRSPDRKGPEDDETSDEPSIPPSIKR